MTYLSSNQIFAKETTQGILFPPEGEADATQPKDGIENPDKPPSSPQISPALAGKKRRFQVIK